MSQPNRVNIEIENQKGHLQIQLENLRKNARQNLQNDAMSQNRRLKK